VINKCIGKVANIIFPNKLYVIIRQKYIFSGILTGKLPQVLRGNMFGSKTFFRNLQKELVYLGFFSFYILLAEVQLLYV